MRGKAMNIKSMITAGARKRYQIRLRLKFMCYRWISNPGIEL